MNWVFRDNLPTYLQPPMTPSRTLLLGALLIPVCALAQTVAEQRTTNSLGQTVTVVGPSGFMKTPPMSEWPVVNDVALEERADPPPDGQAARPARDPQPGCAG